MISKKDLLRETGISYGQLYRWKREGLIPESWFIKQTSYTGQETYFPRAKVLARIRAIQNLKEKYSLDELAKILSPEISERTFAIEDLDVVAEIDKRLIPVFTAAFGKRTFTYIELLFLIAFSTIRANTNVTHDDIEQMCRTIASNSNDIKSTEFTLLVLRTGDACCLMLYPDNTPIFLDLRMRSISTLRLNDISSLVRLKYQRSFNFQFDEGEQQ